MVEPLNETSLEDLGLNTYNHDIPLRSREIPSIDEPEPQPQPLPNCLSLNISLGEERGPEPPIKPYSSDSFKMKEVDSLTINTPPSPHVALPTLRIRIAIIAHALMILRNIMDLNQGLESKEVSPLGKELSLFDRPNEVERGRILKARRLEPILQQQISQRMAPSHHDDCGDGVTINTRRRHHDTCDGVTTTLTASNAQVIFDEKKLGSS
ncbi:hypothetical protein Tco_0431020 [Tanacetum coccineum]